MKDINQSLYTYQKEALAKLKYKSMLAFEPGTGKTITSIAWLKSLEFNAPTKWVICSKSKLNEWKEDLEKWGFKVNLIKTKKDYLNNPRDVVQVVSYDCFKLVLKDSWSHIYAETAVVFDESQALNGNSKLAKDFIKFSKKIYYVLLLTGTIHSTGYQDLCNQMIVLGLVASAWEFSKEYLIYKDIEVNGFRVPILTQYKNVDQLLALLNTKAVFYKKDKIEHNHIDIDIPRNLQYDVLKKNKCLNDMICANNAVLFNSLRQVCSNFVTNNDGTFETFLPEKIERVKELLNNELKNKRVVIFYNWNVELEQLKTIDRPLSFINGKKHDRSNFENNENGVILIQYKAGGTGIDGLQISNNCIFYSPTTSGGMFEQAQKRVDRIGQTQTVNYYYLITRNSIEVDMYKNIKKYKSFTEKMFTEGMK